MIKISFSGFSGNGKTTLLNEVKKILSLKYKVESCDELKSKNPFDESQKYSFVSQFFQFSTQINEENVKWMSRLDFLLCDQSVLDYWIHWNTYIKDKALTSLLLEKNTILERMYHFWIKSYDLIFLIHLDLKDFGKREFYNDTRVMDPDNIKRYEDLYKETVADSNLKIIEIWNNKSIDESAHEIIKHIYEFKTKENSEYNKTATTS